MLERLPEASLATLAALAQEDGVTAEQLITALVNNEDALRHERAARCGKSRQSARVQGTRATCFERAPLRNEKHDESKEGPLCA